MLQQGSIVERGAHAQALARGSRYAESHALQEELPRSGLTASQPASSTS